MEQNNKNKNFIYLLLIISTALFLRFFMLGSQSLWMDEAAVYTKTNVDSVKTVYSKVFSHGGHIGPLFHILNYLFCFLFGYSEWAIRMPSAIYGTISVILVYKIAESLKNKNVALFSATLMAISPIHIWYSQEARMYSLWIMLILFTTFLFIKILQEKKLWLWILFTIFASLSIWTFLNSIFVFFALGLYLLIYFKKYKRELCFYFISMSIVLVSYLPGIVPLLAKGPSSAMTTIGSARKTTIFDFIYAFFVFNVGTTFGPSLLTIRELLKQLGATTAVSRILSQYGILIIPSMLLYGCMFLYSIYKAIIKRKSENNSFILIILFIPLILIFGITLFSNLLPFNVRYILCTLPFYLILLSAGLNEVQTKKKWILFACMIFFSGFSLFNHYFKSEYSKVDFRYVVKYLNDNMTNSDKAVIIHEGADLLLIYYNKTDKLKQYCIPLKDTFENASSIINNSNKIYYVKSIRTQTYDQKAIQQIENLLTKDFQLLDSTTISKNIEIKTYDR